MREEVVEGVVVEVAKAAGVVEAEAVWHRYRLN